MDSEQLSNLVALIANAVDVVKEHSAASPSSRINGSVNGASTSSAELRRAIWTIEGACTQLVAQVARPQDILVNKFMAFFEPACLNVALSAKIPDILQEHPTGLHISELEKKTGIPQQKLGRILRLLATKHVFREVNDHVFANNHLSNNLVSSSPLAPYGLHLTDTVFKATSILGDVLRDPELNHSNSPVDSTFSQYFKVSGTIFDYFKGTSPEQVKRVEWFDRGLMAWGAAIEATSVVHEFPWKSLKPGSTVCDVGGGVGTISMELAKQYPSLRVILQDMPGKIEFAKTKVWPEKCPEALQGNRVEFLPLNFFQETPKPGCDVYFLKNVLHDWNNEDCIQILNQTRKAMSPHSRLLVYEFIIQSAARSPAEDSSFTQAPEPLLPNYGDGRIRQYTMDVDMMLLLNSQERTLAEFKSLGEAAGLKYLKLWEVGEMGILEFVNADENSNGF